MPTFGEAVNSTPNYLKSLEAEGLLSIGSGCIISPNAIFDPSDLKGDKRPISLSDRCRIMPGAILYGGVHLGEDVIVEEYSIVGKPELGYAVGKVYDGTGAESRVGPSVIVRSGTVVYASVTIGAETTIGHKTLLRTGVTIGKHTQVAHGITVERETTIGDYVRCSPLCHITSRVVLEDRVFLGAGVVTINDKGMIWKNERLQPDLVPPYFEHGAKVGSGSVIAAGVRIGREALVGSGSVVTHDIPAYALAYGVPARVKGDVKSLKA